MKFIGEVEIIKEYEDGVCEVIHQSKNTIAEGMAYGIVNIMASYGSTDLEDYGISYFQFGVGNLSSNFPLYSTNKSFYSLASAFETSSYGTETIQQVITLDQIVSENGNFVYPVEYITSLAPFVAIDKKNKAIVNDAGFSVKLVLDKTMGNGKDISEVGLFMDNPDGYPNKKQPILVAYKSFTPISKTSDFDLVILWRITVQDIGNNNLGFLGVNTRQYYTFDFVSGIGSLATGTDFPDRFELGIPPTYDYEGAPLVVALHGLGQDANQWRLTSNYRVNQPSFTPSSVTKTPLYQNVLDRGWFYLAPHGRVGAPQGESATWQPYFATPQSIAGPAAAGSSIYDHAKGTLNNWNNQIIFSQFKKILDYTVNHYPIDRNRIYFVGFSQGGGCALNYASHIHDCSPSAINPAAIASVGGTFNNWKLWQMYAVSSLGSSIYWPYPNRANQMAPAGEVLVFWNNCSGNLNYIPSALTHIGNYGPSAYNYGTNSSLLSSLTPSDAPFIYDMTTTVGFNLFTSSYTASNCTYNNIRHLPLYQMYSQQDSQGEIVTVGNDVLSNLLSSTSIHSSNYKVVVSSLNDILNMWFDLGVSPSLLVFPNTMDTHAVGIVDQEDMLDFLASATLKFPTEASTVVTTPGKYWYFNLDTTLTNIYSSSLITSGLGQFVWNIQPSSNSLTISHVSPHIKITANVFAPEFNLTQANFNPTSKNPLKVYNLSSQLYPTGLNRAIAATPIVPSKIIFYPYSGTVISSVGDELIKVGSEYFRPSGGATIIASFDTNRSLVMCRRLGYYEIYP
jgi:predicted esterase